MELKSATDGLEKEAEAREDQAQLLMALNLLTDLAQQQRIPEHIKRASEKFLTSVAAQRKPNELLKMKLPASDE